MADENEIGNFIVSEINLDHFRRFSFRLEESTFMKKYFMVFLHILNFIKSRICSVIIGVE